MCAYLERKRRVYAVRCHNDSLCTQKQPCVRLQKVLHCIVACLTRFLCSRSQVVLVMVGVAGELTTASGFNQRCQVFSQHCSKALPESHVSRRAVSVFMFCFVFEALSGDCVFLHCTDASCLHMTGCSNHQHWMQHIDMLIASWVVLQVPNMQLPKPAGQRQV